MDIETLRGNGQYAQVLVHGDARDLLGTFVEDMMKGQPKGTTVAPKARNGEYATAKCIGLAALAGFLQANVTGPVLESVQAVEHMWAKLEQAIDASGSLRRACFTSLDADGVSIYPYTPHIELFCLARWIFLGVLRDGVVEDEGVCTDGQDPAEASIAWLQLRVHVWHYKLLIEPNAGPGSVFNKATQWSDLPRLQELIRDCLDAVHRQMDHGSWDKDSKVLFLVEETNVYAMLGLDGKAKKVLDSAAKSHGFQYVLSGALGKRTRFQDKSTSQLVVLAKSALDCCKASGDASVGPDGDGAAVPEALPLNNDTLLEHIDFSDEAAKSSESEDSAQLLEESVPPDLRGLGANDQPQLSPIDQIILLSVATLKDAFSPADSLTLEEILPFATRVLSDKVANWQVYSQALIVRSRIELHRSRTVERAVLQMQAMVDQVVVDTTTAPTEATTTTEKGAKGPGHDVPTINVFAPDDAASTKPTSFLPPGKPAEQAPPQVRLRFVHALSTPPRWHLESELAFAWAGVGSLVSALEIFKRLRLWAEVALCLASSSAVNDEGGRGTGGEAKARALIRWQLFHATDASLEPEDSKDGAEMDVISLRADDFHGPERNPPPPNAPRLWCILGDIEAEPAHYDRAWELSKFRYARAQRSLGEHYLQQHAWDKAREAYQKAVGANRLNSQLWSRLGDIELRLGRFAEAAEAYGRAIGAAGDVSGGEDARTWSNLGSALYSLYTETMKKQDDSARDQNSGSTSRRKDEEADSVGDKGYEEEEILLEAIVNTPKRENPALLLSQSLAAFKRGATISHGNWRIWDNVVTLASRMRPPAIGDMILALHNILAVRSNEKAVDVDIIRLLLSEAVLTKPKPANGQPARGSSEKSVCDLLETTIVPLITHRSDLWELVTRERLWRGDLAGAIDAAEKGWRAALGGASGGSLGSTVAASGDGSGGGDNEESDETKRNWLENAEAWDTVVARTDGLVSVLKNYGPEVATVGGRWKMKARSALRSVMGKGKERWEGSAGWMTLDGLLATLG